MQAADQKEDRSIDLGQTRLIILDWDGTATENRSTCSWKLLESFEMLLRSEVLIAIVTGTNLQHFLEPLIQPLSPKARGHLTLCLNRGSEVYQFNSLGRSHRVWLRTSESWEDEALDESINQLHSELSRLGLETQVIANRLNRRKLDLIPLPEWKDPKKSQVNELEKAIQKRLVQIPGGLAVLMEKLKHYANQAGLRDPRVSSDLKHIELGLTDKSDSMNWIIEHLVRKNELTLDQAVFFGDEFGSVGNLPGSDWMGLKQGWVLGGVYSLGKEPQGVPPGVIHVGGGPDQLAQILSSFVDTLQMRSGLQSSQLLSLGWVSEDSGWILKQQGFDPSQEGDREPNFSLGNGRVGVRGAISTPIPSSRGDLYLASVFDRKVERLPYSELELISFHRDQNPYSERVTFPSVFQFSVKLNGLKYIPGLWEGERYEKFLDLQSGILIEEFYLPVSPDQEVLVRTSRLVSLADPHLLIQEIELRCSNGEVDIQIDTSLEDPDQNMRHPHLRVHSMAVGSGSFEGFTELHELFTHQSQIRVSLITKLWSGVQLQDRPDVKVKLTDQAPIHWVKLISVHEGEWEDSRRQAQIFGRERILYLISKHYEMWQEFWSISELKFTSYSLMNQALRFNSYQMRIAAGEDPRISIGARALSGHAYEGHVFWDTETFVFPFLLHQHPQLAKNCLRYRFQTLSGAKQRAKQAGYVGACFAWESTLDGSDVTPEQMVLKGYDQVVPIYTGKQQIHITADVAHAVWQYWIMTGDEAWVFTEGAAILVETARFWQSRVSEVRQGFHILKVVGPDEYHHDVDNNYYTNWMARENLKNAATLLTRIQNQAPRVWSQLQTHMSLTLNEMNEFVKISERIYLPKKTSSGVIEQFDGYFDLRERSAEKSEQFQAPLKRLLHWDQVNQEKMIKQADVLMVPFLFPQAWDQSTLRANYLYYEPRTDHGSSLSPAVYAAIAARLGLWGESQKFWDHGLFIDLKNLMKNTSLGVHLGSMGGVWQALVFHILGVFSDSQGLLRVAPRLEPLPELWRGIQLKLKTHGQTIQVVSTPEGRVELWPM